MTEKIGFAKLSPEERTEMARIGGKAKREGPRGFATLNKRKLKQITRKGGKTKTAKGFAKTGNASEMAKLRWAKHKQGETNAEEEAELVQKESN